MSVSMSEYELCQIKKCVGSVRHEVSAIVVSVKGCVQYYLRV